MKTKISGILLLPRVNMCIEHGKEPISLPLLSRCLFATGLPQKLQIYQFVFLKLSQDARFDQKNVPKNIPSIKPLVLRYSLS